MQTLAEPRTVSPRLTAALAQQRQGRSIVPQKAATAKDDRIPLVKWKPYQTERAGEQTIRQWWKRNPYANPMIVTGAISNLIALDLDSAAQIAAVNERGLPPTCIVDRGASDRCHVHFNHPGFPVATKKYDLGNGIEIEVKGDGGMIPAPGAAHWSGATYADNGQPVADCPPWLIDLLKPAPPKPRPERQPNSRANLDNMHAWAQAALDGIYQDVKASAPGNHFTALKSGANRLGTIAAHGLLTRSECIDTIFDACEANGYAAKHRSARKQIEFYFDSGFPHPCELPERELPQRSISRNPVPAQETEPELDYDTADTLESTSFLAYFTEQGLDEHWAAQFRRMGASCLLAALTWVDAVRFGLHPAIAPVLPVYLANYGEQLGYCNPTDRNKVLDTIGKGLNKLAAHGIVIDQAQTDFFHTQELEDSTVPKKSAYAQNGFVYASFDEVIQSWRKWEQSRAIERAHPGYSPAQTERTPDPIAYYPSPECFTGEFGATPGQAEQLVADIAEHLTPRRDELTTRRTRKKVIDDLASRELKLRTPGRAWPLAAGMTFCNHQQLDAARLRGRFDADPTCHDWSNEQWADFLGVSADTVRNLRDLADLIGEQRIEHVDLTPGNVAQQIKNYCRKNRAALINLVARNPESGRSETLPCKIQTATDAQRRGLVVTGYFQLTNLLRVKPEPQPGDETPAPTPNAAQDVADPQPQADETAEAQVKEPRPPRFKPYDGAGLSKGWLWSQVILWLIQAGYPVNEVRCLSLVDAISLAQGRTIAPVIDAMLDEVYAA